MDVVISGISVVDVIKGLAFLEVVVILFIGILLLIKFYASLKVYNENSLVQAIEDLGNPKNHYLPNTDLSDFSQEEKEWAVEEGAETPEEIKRVIQEDEKNG